jgi:hypothetical protein
VRRAAVGLWLTGIAAAGLALCVVSASGAAPAKAARSAGVSCDAGDGIGEARRVAYQLKVNGESLDRAVLKAGDMISTDPSGAVDICLTLGQTACRIGSDTAVRVVPSKGVLLYVAHSAKRVTCDTTTGKWKKVKTPQATILVEDSKRRTLAIDRAEAGPSRASYSIGVVATKTDVEVGSGMVLVASGDQVGSAVLVPRDHKAVVRNGQKPQVRKQSSTVRKLWGSGKGKFRTRGRFSSGLVRG